MTRGEDTQGAKQSSPNPNKIQRKESITPSTQSIDDWGASLRDFFLRLAVFDLGVDLAFAHIVALPYLVTVVASSRYRCCVRFDQPKQSSGLGGVPT